MITYHFLGKDEIVSALLARAVDRIDQGAAAAVRESQGPGHSRLTAATRAMVDGFLGEPAACAILIAFWSRLQSDPAARAVNAGLYEGWRERAQTLVRELAPRLGARRRAAIAALLVGQVIGIVTQAIFDPGSIAVDDAVREAGRALEGLVEL